MHKICVCMCVYIYIYRERERERERERDTYIFSLNSHQSLVGRYNICMFKIHLLLLFHLNIAFPTDINHLYTTLLIACRAHVCMVY